MEAGSASAVVLANDVLSGFFHDSDVSLSSLGDPDLFDTESSVQRSRFNAVIGVKRNTLNYSVKNLFPILILLGLLFRGRAAGVGAPWRCHSGSDADPRGRVGDLRGWAGRRRSLHINGIRRH